MYKSIYDCFKHWYEPWAGRDGQIYFYSDPHFNDPESQYFRGHNFISAEEQISRINKKVSRRDTLIILGDINDVTCVSKIKAGRKILILGNHDRGASYYSDYFDEIYEGCLMISPKIILSHEPVNFNFALNIHGHTHAFQHTPKTPFNIREYIADPAARADDYFHLDITAEKVNYTPVCLKDIINSGILKNIPDIHRSTIDSAIDRKQLKNQKTQPKE